MKHTLVAALAITGFAVPAFADDIVINMTAANSTQQILEGAETETMRYTGELVQGPESALTVVPGTYLGPVISVNTGDSIRVNMQNNLGVDHTTHWHGLDVPDAADGHPKDPIADGDSRDYEFIVRN